MYVRLVAMPTGMPLSWKHENQFHSPSIQSNEPRQQERDEKPDNETGSYELPNWYI